MGFLVACHGGGDVGGVLGGVGDGNGWPEKQPKGDGKSGRKIT